MKANPLASTIGPSLKHTQEQMAYVRAKHAMLRAAIAVVSVGPAALSNFPDPFGNGPFQYRKTKGGFELASALVYKDHPVVLAIGANLP